MNEYHVSIDLLYYTLGFIYGILLTHCTLVGIVALIMRKELNPVKKLIKYSALTLALSATIVFSIYVGELLTAYFGGAKYEMESLKIRITGPYWWAYLYMIVTTCLPTLPWLPKVRSSIWSFALISFFGLTSLYFERLVIIWTTIL